MIDLNLSLPFSINTQTNSELINLYKNLLKTETIEGDVMEIGCYNGDTSIFLSQYKHKDKNLFLCDTFIGLTDCLTENGDLGITNGDFLCSYELFVKNVNPTDQNKIKIIVGVFPDSAPVYMKDMKFSFIHIDVDTYQSTINSLNYCFPKLSTGGIITIHDYTHAHLLGVKKAVDEFIQDKKIKTELHDTSQISLIKV